MVVDDMSTSRALIVQALEKLSVRNYTTSNDGLAALRDLTAKPVHLVISDYNMPGLDGLGLLQQLRQNPATEKIGFIMITGRAEKEIIERGQQLGMNNYLPKPFTPEQLQVCIEAVVGKL